MGGDPAATNNLWRSLTAEVERLTAGRPRGINFSEDFAVDRVCTAISKLRQQHGRQEALAEESERLQSGRGGAEELQSLRMELAIEEKKLRIQQSKIDGAKLQIKQAREAKVELEQELESEEIGRREASEGQAKQWREAACKTHSCLASLRTKEQELAHLQAALNRPASLIEVWDGIVRKLQAELDIASVEALEAKREYDKLTLECHKTERDSVRDELVRIASRAGENSEHSTQSTSNWSSNSVLDEAQRVLERMDRLNSRQSSSLSGATTLIS